MTFDPKKLRNRRGTVRTHHQKSGRVSCYWYYTNPQTGKRTTVNLTGLNFKEAQQIIDDISLAIDAYKRGITAEFNFGRQKLDAPDLGELVLKYNTDETRRREFDHKTIKRSEWSLNKFCEIIGNHTLIQDFTDKDKDLIERFKIILFDQREGNPNKIKTGINNELKAIKAFFRYCADKGWISKSQVPTIKKFKVDTDEQPKILSDAAMVKLETELEGLPLLAFRVLKYTAARGIEICMDKKHDRGLRWRDVDWFRDEIRLYAKSKVRKIPLHSKLREHLVTFKDHPDRFVVPLSQSYLSRRFREAMRKVGVWEPGFSMHVIRHTVLTKICREEGIEIARLFAGHADLSTTQIYVHLADEIRTKIEIIR